MNIPHAPSRTWTLPEVEARIVRHADLRPCYNAFIDTRSPGSEAKENFTIIGPGVSENPDQHVHIAEPHGFNIGGARQPPGCVNSQHSHTTAEVFLVHKGTWRFDLGEHGDDAQVTLSAGDVISLPVDAFRGFTNVGDDSGFLFAILGQDDPGRVMWAPAVFDMAREYGLVLLESGRLIDTVAGQRVPAEARPMPVTSSDQIRALKRVSQSEAETFVWRGTASDGDRGAAGKVGASTSAIIGVGAPLGWPHGFSVERIDLVVGGQVTVEVEGSLQVVFVHRGDLTVGWRNGATSLGPGDTITIPPGGDWTLTSDGGCTAYRVERD